MNGYDSALIGAGAAIGGGALLNWRFGNQDVESGDRLKQGAMFGGAALLTVPLWKRAIVGGGFSLSRPAGMSRADWLRGAGSAVRNAPLGRGASWAAGKARGYGAGLQAEYRQQIAQGASRLSALSTFATVPVMGGLGAVLGAGIAGEGHRTQGALIGGAVGSAGAVAFRATKLVKNMGAGKRLGLYAGLAVVAFSAGQAMNHEYSEQAGVANPMTGEDDIVDPSVAARMESGVRNRMQSMNAHGDMVFGMNRKRHG